MHLKNIRKSICLEEDSIPLIPDASCGEVTDNNIKGYLEAINQISLVHETPIFFKSDRETEIRVQLAAFEMCREKDMPLFDEADDDIKELTKQLEDLRQAAASEKNKGLKETYLAKLRESVKDKSFEIEMFADFKGKISQQNIDALATALVEVEVSERKNFEVSIPTATMEETTDIQLRLNDARIAFRLKHFENCPPVLSM